jgi:hypothetical protein
VGTLRVLQCKSGTTMAYIPHTFLLTPGIDGNSSRNSKLTSSISPRSTLIVCSSTPQARTWRFLHWSFDSTAYGHPHSERTTVLSCSSCLLCRSMVLYILYLLLSRLYMICCSARSRVLLFETCPSPFLLQKKLWDIIYYHLPRFWRSAPRTSEMDRVNRATAETSSSTLPPTTPTA